MGVSQFRVVMSVTVDGSQSGVLKGVWGGLQRKAKTFTDIYLLTLQGCNQKISGDVC